MKTRQGGVLKRELGEGRNHLEMAARTPTTSDPGLTHGFMSHSEVIASSIDAHVRASYHLRKKMVTETTFKVHGFP